MSLLSWLFGAGSKSPTASVAPAANHATADHPAPSANAGAVLRMHCDGSFPLACVGESHYQAAFEAICGPRVEEGVDQEVTASLVPEDSNPYDPAAVRVEVRGKLLAYLNRSDARAYRQALAAAGHSGEALHCRARIRGGWDRGEDDQGDYGIYLDLPLYGPSPK